MTIDHDERIGVILVHGIGGQQSGDTTKRFVKAFSARVPADFQSSPARLQVGDREIRFYEAYWADELEGDAVRSSFNYYDPQIIAWFPILNQRAGLFQPPGYSRKVVLAWTWALAGAAIGAVLMLPLFPMMDEVLDNLAADVTNYVKSAGGQVKRGSKLQHVARRVVNRVHEQLLAAASDDCREIHIVAHSLGTVIVYHALSGFTLPQDKPISEDLRRAVRLVTRLYTIGSPLEKVRFIWPKLISTEYLAQPTLPEPMGRANYPIPEDRAQGLSWVNFYDRLDPISGPLRHFGIVENRRVGGGAGYLAAHTAYFQHPAFISKINEGFTGEVGELEKPKFWLRFKLATKTLSQSAFLTCSFLWMLTLVVSLALFILSVMWSMVEPVYSAAPVTPLTRLLAWASIISGAVILLLVGVNLAIVLPLFGRRITRKINDLLTVPMLLSAYLFILDVGIIGASAFAQRPAGLILFGISGLLIVIVLPTLLGRRAARSIHARWWS